jgi:hypothetical protein
MASNVRATAISSGAIRVTWTDTNGGSAKYVVSNGNVSSADLPGGTTSYTWGGRAAAAARRRAAARVSAATGQRPRHGQALALLAEASSVTADHTPTGRIEVTPR